MADDLEHASLIDAMLADLPVIIKSRPERRVASRGMHSILQAKRSANKQARKAKPSLSPSVITALKTVTAERTGSVPMIHPNLATSQEHVNRMEVMHRTLAKALNSTHSEKCRPAKATFVPICTVDMDNEQLRWDRAGVPLCTAGQACVATRLAHAPGPLHAFTSAVSPNPSLCLLCIRLHAQMINKATMAISNVQASLVPPFTNLVNCAGGYYDWALGVNTSTQRVFSTQCAIVGACPNLKVRHSSLDHVWWVDQSEIIWRPSDFQQGAQTTTAAVDSPLLSNNETANSLLPGTV